MKRAVVKGVALVLALAAAACGPPRSVPGEEAKAPVLRASTPLDTTPKEEPRMVPPEAYVSTYLNLFGRLAPLDAQKRARGKDGNQLFDAWSDYLATLGFPDYRLDLPRSTQTNAIMLATFERIGDALCDRATEHDLGGVAFEGEEPGRPRPKVPTPRPVADRVIFAFDPIEAKDEKSFAPKLDVLHREFLGYPLALAPPERTARMFALYTKVKTLHAAKKTRFTPEQAAWSSVCQAMIRHPEIHLY